MMRKAKKRLREHGSKQTFRIQTIAHSPSRDLFNPGRDDKQGKVDGKHDDAVADPPREIRLFRARSESSFAFASLARALCLA